MKDKVLKAAKMYFMHRGFTHILDLSDEDDLCIAAYDEDDEAISICSVSYQIHGEKFEEPEHDHEYYEDKLIKATKIDFVDCANKPVRFDHLTMLIVGDNRALIRHHQGL